MAKQTKSSANKSQQDVRKFYEQGCQVRDAPSEKRGKKIYDLRVVERFATKTGLSRNLIEKARMFARLYTKKDLDKLLSLGSKHGVPLGRRHVIHLLSVKDRAERSELQKLASKNAWSTRELAIEIKKRLGKQSTGGRRLLKAQTREEALIQVEAMSSQWVRWYRDLRKAGILDMRNMALKALDDIAPAIEELQRMAARAVGARPLTPKDERHG